MTPSIISDFLEGRAVIDQWAGLFILVTLGVVGFVALLRQHVRHTKDDSRNERGGRVRF